eukprot:TRINITY_DN1677_c0_g1_i3.p1 TRINITY_DN1677_c0_g1~~TRINITY_DN1677_c0_g1_i3.p1  ORF type:complete len:480 (-),score=149.43 TRINITY_DN1677_c0_g1_i3:69-1508(-)
MAQDQDAMAAFPTGAANKLPSIHALLNFSNDSSFSQWSQSVSSPGVPSSPGVGSSSGPSPKRDAVGPEAVLSFPSPSPFPPFPMPSSSSPFAAPNLGLGDASHKRPKTNMAALKTSMAPVLLQQPPPSSSSLSPSPIPSPSIVSSHPPVPMNTMPGAPMAPAQGVSASMLVDHAPLLTTMLLANMGFGAGFMGAGFVGVDAHKKRKRGLNKQSRSNVSCQQCGTSSTPEWRKGPSGPGTLCNACGLQYSKKIREEKLREKERHALGLGINVGMGINMMGIKTIPSDTTGHATIANAFMLNQQARAAGHAETGTPSTNPFMAHHHHHHQHKTTPTRGNEPRPTFPGHNHHASTTPLEDMATAAVHSMNAPLTQTHTMQPRNIPPSIIGISPVVSANMTSAIKAVLNPPSPAFSSLPPSQPVLGLAPRPMPAPTFVTLPPGLGRGRLPSVASPKSADEVSVGIASLLSLSNLGSSSDSEMS